MKYNVRKRVELFDDESKFVVAMDELGWGYIKVRGQKVEFRGFIEVEMIINMLKRAVNEIRSSSDTNRKT